MHKKKLSSRNSFICRWKQNFLSREEKRAPGFKAVKDRLTLVLGDNANEGFKLNSLLVYHSKNLIMTKVFLKI